MNNNGKKLIKNLSSLLSGIKAINTSLKKAVPPAIKPNRSQLVEQIAQKPVETPKVNEPKEEPSLPKTIPLDRKQTNVQTERTETGKLLVKDKPLKSRLAFWEGDEGFSGDEALKAINGLFYKLKQSGAPVEELQEVMDHRDDRIHALRKEHARIKKWGFNEETGAVFEPQSFKEDKPRKKSEPVEFTPAFPMEWLDKTAPGLGFERARDLMMEMISHHKFPKNPTEHKVGWIKRLGSARNMMDLMNIGKDHILYPSSGIRYLK